MSGLIEMPDGVRVYTRTAGSSDAPAVLFLHGILQSHICWEYQFADPRLLKRHLIAFDLRGHGGSDKPEDPEAYRKPGVWADELAAVIKMTGARKPVLCAWSFGGRVVLDYIEKYGQNDISGIVLANSAAKTGGQFRSETSARLLPMAASEDFAEMLNARIAFLKACFHKAPQPEWLERCIAYNFVTPAAVLRLITGQAVDHDGTLASIRIPTLIIHGQCDPLISPAVAEHVLTILPSAKLLRYDDIGHSPFAECPDRFNTDLNDFLDNIELI